MRLYLKSSDGKMVEFQKKEVNEVAKKCLIWDHIAGMADSYIIKKYESFHLNGVKSINCINDKQSNFCFKKINELSNNSDLWETHRHSCHYIQSIPYLV